VIASKVGGLTSFIQDELTGFLVPEEDEKSLAEKILVVLNNPSLKDRLGTKARNRAREFSWHNIARQMSSLYQHLREERDIDTKGQTDSSFRAPERNHAALST